ncbi:MAG: hypothetical protein F6K23_34765 [Okeania sp. SIO2C9]|uniref:hypothetical protein n=1 Tax=Okeania sp. SIO2C9 TaxID=2607791 RepID=UPI0013BEEDC1|nr:hypothetical protein [Okeania sp. SIO2C9]NEQ77726.1 hypothetical protein [Okeania sp. SIO2C9]
MYISIKCQIQAFFPLFYPVFLSILPDELLPVARVETVAIFYGIGIRVISLSLTTMKFVLLGYD